MTSPAFVFLLLSLFLVAGANLDTACTQNGSECSDGFVCDKTVDKCKVKTQGTCSANTDCVTGATCESSLCACGDVYTEDTDTNLCTNFDGLVGGNCTNDDVCTDNAKCNDNDVCACEDGYSLHITDGSCKNGDGNGNNAVGLMTSSLSLPVAVISCLPLFEPHIFL